MDWKSYCRYEARRSTGGEGSGDELPKKHFTAAKRALKGGLILSVNMLCQIAARVCRVEDRQRRELQNVMAHNSASDRRCQSREELLGWMDGGRRARRVFFILRARARSGNMLYVGRPAHST